MVNIIIIYYLKERIWRFYIINNNKGIMLLIYFSFLEKVIMR